MEREELEKLIQKHCYSYKEAADVLDINNKRLYQLIANEQLHRVQHEGVKLLMKDEVDERQRTVNRQGGAPKRKKD